VAICETCHWLESHGVENLNPLNKGGSQKIGSVTVTMTHAVHSCGILDDSKFIYGGEAAGYVLRFEDGRSLYFSGDTNVFSDMQLIRHPYHPELALLPIGDLFTMSLAKPPSPAACCVLNWPSRCTSEHSRRSPDVRNNFPRSLGTAETKVWSLEPGKSVKW
jgi:hypothetical protein